MSVAPTHLTPDEPYGVKGEWIRHDLLALVPEGARRVLSLGCGTGATETLLQERCIEVWGLDISSGAIEVAAKRLHRAWAADVETDELAQLPTGHFDVVLCGDVLEHLRYPEHVLDRLRGWLAPGGSLVVAVPNATHHSVIRTLVLRRDWRYEDGGLFDRGHYRLFTRKSLVRLLAEHGFTVDVTACSKPIGPKLRVVYWLLKPLAWLWRGLDEYFVYTWTLRAHT
ncbi:MAG: class I SAM-dependent methyltransferase [Planctomycetota bacterium]